MKYYSYVWLRVLIYALFFIISVYINFNGIVHKQVYRFGDSIEIISLGKVEYFYYDNIISFDIENTDNPDLIRVNIQSKEYKPKSFILSSDCREKMELLRDNIENIEEGGIYTTDDLSGDWVCAWILVGLSLLLCYLPVEALRYIGYIRRDGNSVTMCCYLGFKLEFDYDDLLGISILDEQNCVSVVELDFSSSNSVTVEIPTSLCRKLTALANRQSSLESGKYYYSELEPCDSN